MEKYLWNESLENGEVGIMGLSMVVKGTLKLK